MRKKLLSIVAVMALGISLIACGGSSNEEATSSNSASSGGAAVSEDAPTIVMIPHSIGNEFYLGGKIGADEAAEELGINFIFDGPTNPEVDQQIEFINNYVAAGVDAIIISPLDSDAVAPALDAARDAGIKVITFDVDANGGRDYYLEPVPALGYGEYIVDTMMERVDDPDGAEWVFLIESLSDIYQKTSGERAVEYGAEKYPETSGELRQAGMSQDAAYKLTNDLVSSKKNLKGIISIGTVIYPGIIEALKDAGLTDEIINIGMGTPNATAQYLKDGDIEMSLMWICPDMGYSAVYTAYNMVVGNLNDGDTTMECGRLGTLNITEENSVIMSEVPFAFTADNVDDYDF